MVTANNLDFDTRILNEAKTLAPFFDVMIVTPGCSEPTILENPLFKVKRAKTVSSGPKDFKRIINLWPLYLAVWRESPDIFHAHDLPGLLCAWLPAAAKGKILIYDSHELWSDITLFGLWKIFRWPFRILENILMPKVTAIITVNESITQILKKRYHKPTIAVYNYTDVSQKKTTKSKTIIEPTGKKIILYIGALQPGRGLDKIIESAQYLDDSVQILLIGYGPERAKLAQTIKDKKLKNKVKLLPALPHDQIINIIKKAHLGLCLIENVSLSYYYSTPNKLFQYIAAEVPILASNFPEQEKIVLENQAGEVVDPSNPRQIAQKISFMLQPRQQAFYRRHLKNLAQKKYNWAIEAEKLVSAYKIWQVPKTRDFSLAKYSHLCQVLREHYRVITFAESLKGKQPAQSVILRHDIDRMPANALKVAELEAKMGLRASYYFRSSQLQTHLDIIKKVAVLGHEVGYHYECLDQAKGNEKQAIQLFEENLAKFRQIYPVTTIAMHGNPLTRYDNRHLWRSINFQKFGIMGETYLSLAQGTFYFSDTGRTWSNRFKIKDVPVKTHHEHRRFQLEGTDDLINLIEKHEINQLCIVTHPERWSDNWLGWVSYLCLDKAVQIVKKIVKK